MFSSLQDGPGQFTHMTISTYLMLAVRRTHVILEPWIWPSSPRVLRSSVVRASDRCRKGHRFNSCRGLRFFLCPVLVTCWSYPLDHTITRGEVFIVRAWLHDTGATFAPARVHSGSLSWLYICLHDTTATCHASASHPGVSSSRLLYRSENFTPIRNFATLSCKRGNRSAGGLERVAHT